MAVNYPMQEIWVQTWYAAFAQDWVLMFWDTSMIVTFFGTFAEATELQTCFAKLPNKAAQADFARYVILYAYGGMYVDTDMECLRKFDMLLQDTSKDIYVSLNNDLNSFEKMLKNTSINNHWFYCPAPLFSGLWELVISIVAAAIHPSKRAGWTITVTGPTAFGKMVRRHKASYVSWHLLEAKSIVNCEDRYSFNADTFPSAYAVHHLSGTWLPVNVSFRKSAIAAYGFVRKNSMMCVLVSTVIIGVLLGVVTFLVCRGGPASPS